ncbi:MAG: TIM barrel protein [Abitibacteriaceae bacterium]|nr:TIM barrel protein [Abditibacteriaceae bacterium]
MDLSICSFSFHRLLAAGKQDIFKYITDCKELGCTLLDPWNAHLAELKDGDSVLFAGHNPDQAHLSAVDEVYVDQVKGAAEVAGLPFGCIAVDGAHIYEADPEVREANRAKAYRWISIAQTLKARQVRIDSGGPAELPDDVLAIIVDGYNDVIKYAADRGVEVLIENHWGPSPIPENLVRILDSVEGLGLLFDTNNWADGMQEKGWQMCAKYARATHVKTFQFDAAGNEPSVDIPKAMHYLLDAGYNGAWGIESCPTDGDEYTGARKTIELIHRVLNA